MIEAIPTISKNATKDDKKNNEYVFFCSLGVKRFRTHENDLPKLLRRKKGFNCKVIEELLVMFLF